MKKGKGSTPVFDGSAVLELLQCEPDAESPGNLQSEAVVNAENVAEVIAKLAAQGMPLTEAQAEPALAADSARYVHKGVSLGDRCFLAAVRQHGSGWTSDRTLGTIFGGRVPPLSFFR